MHDNKTSHFWVPTINETLHEDMVLFTQPFPSIITHTKGLLFLDNPALQREKCLTPYLKTIRGLWKKGDA